jgi:putative ATPase
MRPRDLDELVGQEHLVGTEGALRRMVAAGRLSSILLWGPPGTGKTTIAKLLASAVDVPLEELSATTSGVADVRAVIARAREWREGGGRPIVLFIDEIHRFNKAQQDTLLPHVEEGVVVLVGATTENPWFEVNSALLSRLRVFRLATLDDEQVGAIVDRALADERGLGGRVVLADDAREHLVAMSAGDVRAALNILEAATAMVGRPASAVDPVDAVDGSDGAGRPVVGVEDIEAAAQQRVLAYDRAGDGHYATISAFIKSLRGNDPDAALYWLATMVGAGEDPKFIARRLIISASEDVGNADPRALQVAVAAAQALDWVGLPEAQYALAQATVFIASSPKSAASGRAYFAALDDVQRLGSQPVPGHLQMAPYRQMRQFGIGVGYRNPHDYEGADVDQRYLPDRLVGKRYYRPTDQGYEATIKARMEERRTARPTNRRRRGAEGS